MPEVPAGKEYLPAPSLLDPRELYTGEGKVYAKGLQERQNSLEPMLYGVDAHGHMYVTDGNHRAIQRVVTWHTTLGATGQSWQL